MPLSTSTTLVCRLRGYQVTATPEEHVRQTVIDALFALGYPWHTWRCEVSHPALGIAAGRVDLVYGLATAEAGGSALAIIECKAQGLTDADAAQVAAYARAFRAQVWALTDGTQWQVWSLDATSPTTHFPAFNSWD